MSASWMRVLAALGALAGLVLLAVFLLRPTPETARPASPAPQAFPTFTGERRFPTGSGEVVPGQQAAASPSASVDQPGASGSSPCGERCYCAGNADPCAAGRTCTPGGCDGAIERKGWRLRLGGLKGGGADLEGETRVCARLAGKREEACASLKEIRSGKCPAGARLPVTTEQLLGGGLDIDVVNAQGQTLASARGASYKFLTDRDLCLGVRFGGGKFTGTTKIDLLWFFLDDA